MRTRPVIALLPSLLLLIACADAPTRSGDGGGIAHATGSEDLVVRVAFEGGFVPLEWNLTNAPSFSLYGDGSLVVPGAQIEIYPGPALPALSTRSVTEPGIQAILEETLGAIQGAPDDLSDLGSMGVADASTTVITVNAGGVHRTIRAYALSELPERPEGMSEDEYRARERLSALVTELGSLDPWLPMGSLGPETTYEGAAARLFVGNHRKVEDLPQEPIRWPLGVDLGSFGGASNPQDTYRCGTVTGEDWTTVRGAATQANQLTPWTDGGERFTILFRPLLPDESGC